MKSLCLVAKIIHDLITKTVNADVKKLAVKTAYHKYALNIKKENVHTHYISCIVPK